MRGWRGSKVAVALAVATVGWSTAPVLRLLGGSSVAALTAVEGSRVFVPAADPLFCSAKKVGQKRRPLRWRSALRTDCTRRQGLTWEASETRCAQTADASLSV